MDERLDSISNEETAFERETSQCVSRLRRDLQNILSAIKVRRPGELQRTLQLDTTLAYKIYRVLGERSLLAAALQIPSRVALERFAQNATAKGAAPEFERLLLEGYAQFEALIEKHAGDRNSFNSLATNAAGPTEEGFNADVQHRRSVFRGLSHLIGVQAEARLMSCMLVPSNGQGYNFALVSGYAGLRVLRRFSRVRVHGAHMESTLPDESMSFSRRPLDLTGSPDNHFLAKYSRPSDIPLEVAARTTEGHSWVQTSLIRPEIGNTGLASVLFGEKVRSQEMAERVYDQVSLPSELLMLDVLLLPQMIRDRPRLEVFLGEDKPAHRLSDALPMHGHQDIERLGRGSEVLAIPHFADYPTLMCEVASELGHDVSEMDVWRVRLEYPIYQSTVRVSLQAADTRH